MKGFEGANCGRMVCPGVPRCSSRGRCLSMRRLTQSAIPFTSLFHILLPEYMIWSQLRSIAILEYNNSFLFRFSNALPLSMSSVEYVHIFNDTTWDADFGHMCLCDSSWKVCASFSSSPTYHLITHPLSPSRCWMKVGLGYNQTQQAEYFGPACQYRHCPTGDDPMTTVRAHRTPRYLFFMNTNTIFAHSVCGGDGLRRLVNDRGQRGWLVG